MESFFEKLNVEEGKQIIFGNAAKNDLLNNEKIEWSSKEVWNTLRTAIILEVWELCKPKTTFPRPTILE